MADAISCTKVGLKFWPGKRPVSPLCLSYIRPGRKYGDSREFPCLMPSITDGVHRNENFEEIIQVFSTFSNFSKKKKNYKSHFM